METKTTQKKLSSEALSIIDEYLHFKLGSAVCSVPYFNNRTVHARAALRARIGKGLPGEIRDEMQSIMVKSHVKTDSLTAESLKKLLVENDFGIECSGFAYHVLDAENQARGLGKLERHITFVNCSGLIGKIRCTLRPAENCDVSTLANDVNSHTISLDDVQPGDMITMIGSPEGDERDHILVIHMVEQIGSKPTKIHYSHAVAYPTDGLYGSGIRQGTIDLSSDTKNILEGLWSEDGSVTAAQNLFTRAQKSKTELRTLN